LHPEEQIKQNINRNGRFGELLKAMAGTRTHNWWLERCVQSSKSNWHSTLFF
jgi:hypothetical protein